MYESTLRYFLFRAGICMCFQSVSWKYVFNDNDLCYSGYSNF